MKCLEFESFHDVSSLAKPKEHLITLFYTLSSKAYPVIKVCQFICPSFSVIVFFEFFKDSNSLFKADFLCLVELVL